MFILPAFAEGQGAAPQAPGLMVQLLPFVLIIVIFYFLLIRPQKKRQDEHRKMLEAMKKGDEVVTNAGIFAQIADIRDDHFVLKIADNVRVKVTKSSISHKQSGQGAVQEERAKT